MQYVATGMPHIDSDRSTKLELFARYASVLPWFNIDVLHKLYINIFVKYELIKDHYDDRAITCADLIHSPNVDRINDNIFTLRPQVQDMLRNTIREQTHIMMDLGRFMIAYTFDCRHHFPGPKYIESYRIEGNLILNPSAEAGRITRHVVNRINQISDPDAKKNSVAYYLNILHQHAVSPEQSELIKFLEGYQNFNHKSGQIPRQWKKLKEASAQSESIAIRLPRQIKDAILKEITATTNDVASKQIYSLIIGINNYQSETIDGLEAARSDAEHISKFITINKTKNSVHHSTLLIDHEATRAGIINALNTMIDQIEEGDTLLFYFAGYGGQETNQINAGQKFQSVNLERLPDVVPFLVCYDTFVDADSFGLAISELEHQLSSLPKNSSAIAIFDCGFADSHILPDENRRPRSLSLVQSTRLADASHGMRDSEESEPKMNEFNGIFLFAGSQGNVFETPDHGWFTHGLCEALEEHDNLLAYTNLLSGPNSIKFPSTSQSPYFEIKGNFSANTLFLDGILAQGNQPARERIQKAIENNNAELDLSGISLRRIPPEVFHMTNLKTLDISHNQLAEIPAEISEMSELEVLVANNNPILSLDAGIGRLQRLRAVILFQCQLSAFPEGLLKCTNLENLQLEGNQIKWIPVEIKDLPVLRQIDLRNNPLLNLPTEMLQASASELTDYFSAWQPLAETGEPFVLIIGMDYHEKLRNITLELDAIHKSLDTAGIKSLDLYNPDSLNLFRTLYQHKNVLSILHFAAYQLNEISNPQYEQVTLGDADLVEMFKCIRQNKFEGTLLLLNSCETEPLIQELLINSFDIAIGMAEKVEDQMAFEFSHQFYDALTKGKTLKDAFTQIENKFLTS